MTRNVVNICSRRQISSLAIRKFRLCKDVDMEIASRISSGWGKEVMNCWQCYLFYGEGRLRSFKGIALSKAWSKPDGRYSTNNYCSVAFVLSKEHRKIKISPHLFSCNWNIWPTKQVLFAYMLDWRETERKLSNWPRYNPVTFRQPLVHLCDVCCDVLRVYWVRHNDRRFLPIVQQPNPGQGRPSGYRYGAELTGVAWYVTLIPTADANM